MKITPLKLISVLVPYVAVLIGLYIMKNAWIAIGLYHCGIIVFLIAGDRNGLIKKVYTGWNSIAVIIGMAMAVPILPIVYFFWQFMQLENTSLNSVLVNFGLQGTPWIIFMIYFSTVQPLLEELYWRGYLIYGRNCFSWTDCAFAGYHILVLAWFIKMPWLAIAFILFAVTAYIWRYLAFKYEGLIVPLLSHMVADISIIFVIYILIQ